MAGLKFQQLAIDFYNLLSGPGGDFNVEVRHDQLYSGFANL